MAEEGKGQLDPAALDRLLRIGGQEFLIEMIELFLEHAPQRVEAARTGFDEGDMSALYRAAHSLKSTAANLGARSLQDVAARLEESAATGETEGMAPLLDELERSYQRLRSDLEMERDRRKGTGT
jgi:HPt (histidine-containing phosphotransfer) domain-containing protein